MKRCDRVTIAVYLNDMLDVMRSLGDEFNIQATFDLDRLGNEMLFTAEKETKNEE